MSPINLQNLFYCLCYIPLISSLVCLLFTYQNIAFYITAVCFAVVLLVVAVLLSVFFTSQNISHLRDIHYLSNLSAISSIFLLTITAIFLTIILFYRNNIDKNLSEKQKPVFYALILVNFFNIIGIITTHHLLKLYLFIEVYSLGCLAIISFDNNKQIKQFNFYNYCFNVASSILLLFAFLLMFVIFNDFNITNYWQNLEFSHKTWLASLFFTIFILAVIIKFLPFWQYFYKLKTKSLLSKIFLIEGIFIKTLLAIFLSDKIINNVFSNNPPYFNNFLIILGSILIFYSCFLSIKTQHLKLIALLLSLATVGFLIILLGLNQYSLNYNSFLFWLLHLFFVNFLIFLLIDILQKNTKTSKIWQLNWLKNNVFFKTIFFFFIVQLTFLPITFSFLASWFLLTENLNSQLITIIILSLAVYHLAQAIFANKLLNNLLCLKNFKT